MGERRPELFVPSQSGHIVPSVHGRASGENETITVRGLNVREFFSGQQVRDLAEALMRHQRTGGKLVFA